MKVPKAGLTKDGLVITRSMNDTSPAHVFARRTNGAAWSGDPQVALCRDSWSLLLSHLPQQYLHSKTVVPFDPIQQGFQILFLNRIDDRVVLPN